MPTVVLAGVVAAAVHWLLAAHSPAAPPDLVAPAAVLVFSAGPATAALDAVNAVPVARDIALASWLILAALAGVTTTWAQRLGVASWLAVALGVGVTFLPGTWSTQAPGRDALVLLMLVVLAGAISTPKSAPIDSHRGVALALVALVLVGHQPMVVWVLLPVAFACVRSRRKTVALWAVTALVVAVGATLLSVRVSMQGAACGADARGLAGWLWEAARPGASTGVGAAGRLAHAGRSIAAEFHAFGIGAALWAIWLVGDTHRTLRRMTVATVLGVAVAAASATVTPGLLVAAATVAWLPWYALACHRLSALGRSRSRPVTQLLVVWLAVGLPLARHAVFVPGPVETGAPGLWAATYAGMDAAVVAAATDSDARLARRAGRSLVPAESSAVGRCLGRGWTVAAVGTAVEMLRDHGVTVDDVPVTVPVATLADDLRRGAVVAVALTAEGTRWLRPHDLERVAELGADIDAMRRRSAQASVTTLPPSRDLPGREPAVARAGAASRRLDEVGARRLWHPVSVEVEPGAVRIMAGSPVPQPIVLGDTAAVVVFDRTERPIIRASGAATPGLPMPLYSTLSTLRLGRAVGVAAGKAVPRAVALLPAELPPPIDADTAATVTVHVGSGWHDAEPAGRMAFRWSAGREATASFRLPHPGRLLVTLDASPARTATQPNALRVRVNEVVVATAVDGAATIDVPAAATRQGDNMLSFEADAVVPAGALPGEPRALGAIVRQLRVVRR